MTTLQIAEHGFGQQPNRFMVLGPLQLFLAGREVFKHVPEPQKIRISLAHRATPFLSIAHLYAVLNASLVPIAAGNSDVMLQVLHRVMIESRRGRTEKKKERPKIANITAASGQKL